MFILLKRAFYSVAWIGLTIAISTLLVCIYWHMSTAPGLVNVHVPLQVNSLVTAPGKMESYTLSYCIPDSQKLPTVLYVSRSLQLLPSSPTSGHMADGITFPAVPVIRYEVQNRCESRTLFIGLESFIPAGTYNIRTDTYLKVNPIKTIHQSWDTVNFTINPVGTLPVSSAPIK